MKRGAFYWTKKRLKEIVKLETDNFLNSEVLEKWEFSWENDDPVVQGFYGMNGFHPYRLVMVYIRVTGKQVMHLTPSKTEWFPKRKVPKY